jgi:threonine aldolase
VIDLRSDTASKPTPAMREAIASAEVGDEQLREDPTVNELERRAAETLGQEDSVFVPTATMANEIALRVLGGPGDELIAEVASHIANSEVGGAARLGGLTLRPVVGRLGKISPEQVASVVRPPNIHYAHTTLLAIENTHNAAGGTVVTPAETDALAAAAHERGLKVHVDGARIFNAAVALGVEPAALARSADTLTFCPVSYTQLTLPTTSRV